MGSEEWAAEAGSDCCKTVTARGTAATRDNPSRGNSNALLLGNGNDSGGLAGGRCERSWPGGSKGAGGGTGRTGEGGEADSAGSDSGDPGGGESAMVSTGSEDVTVGNGGWAWKAGKGKGVGGEDVGTTSGGGTPAGHGVASGPTSSTLHSATVPSGILGILGGS